MEICLVFIFYKVMSSSIGSLAILLRDTARKYNEAARLAERAERAERASLAASNKPNESLLIAAGEAYQEARDNAQEAQDFIDALSALAVAQEVEAQEALAVAQEVEAQEALAVANEADASL